MTLGVYVPSAIAPLSPDLTVWREAKGFDAIDGICPLVPKARFPDAAEHVATIAALVHPSMRHRNVGIHRYKGCEGDLAEKELQREAIEISGL